jgi:hypothetical protein
VGLHRTWSVLAVGLLCLPAAPSRGAETAKQDGRDVKNLTALIDRHVEARWKEKGIQPARAAGDGAWLRRVYLDLAGRIPPLREARDFPQDPSPDKRARLVDKLLRSQAFARHFARTWTQLILPQTVTDNPLNGAGMENWLRGQFRDNVGFDRITRAILTSRVDNFGGAGSFFLVNGRVPENLAASTSRVFLGVRLECAQCHNHPFARWKKEQFWEFAAFFTEVQVLTPAQAAKKRAGRLTIPGTKDEVAARTPGAKEPADLGSRTDPRTALAAWVTARDNPYFARATVNRVWALLLGTGLIDPTDSLGEEPTASHPELLDALAKDFVGHGYDLQRLVRAVVLSKPYALSSQGSGSTPPSPQFFARMPVRALSGEQLYESLTQVVGEVDDDSTVNTPARTDFLSRFASADRPVETHATILQALHLMNGPFVGEITDPRKNARLRTLIESRSATATKVEQLYLLTLCRKPTAAEKKRLARHVTAAKDPARAYADVLWVLLNSHEFDVNH